MANIVEIGIDTSALDRDTQVLNELLTKVRAEMDGAYDEIHALDAMWDGLANDAFNQQFKSDYESMKSICNTVASLIECMENASRKYVEGENQVQQVVNSIRI